MPANPDSVRIEREAMEANRRGDRGGAMRLWRQLLELEPGHAGALNALGNACLAAGSAAEARALLERAADAKPGEPAILFNLAAARRACGDPAAALGALEAALVADPYFVQAIFQKATLLESLGRQVEAASVYRDFIDVAPPEVRASERFGPLLAHAEAVVARDNETLRQRIGQVGFPPSPRMADTAAVLVGTHEAFVSRPTFFTVTRLPAIPFFDRAMTPWLERLEQATETIRDEARSLLKKGPEAAGFAPYVANRPGTPLNQWRDLDHDPNWSAFHLIRHGARVDEHCELCPATVALLESLPLFRVEGRGPNAFFSLLAAGTRIPPHTGVTNARATAHLPLIVPPGCGFRVGADTRPWLAGRAWLFDDSIEHEAWNDSSEPRLILIFDVWNPFLDGAEQRYIAGLLSAYGAHRATRQFAEG